MGVPNTSFDAFFCGIRQVIHADPQALTTFLVLEIFEHIVFVLVVDGCECLVVVVERVCIALFPILLLSI